MINIIYDIFKTNIKNQIEIRKIQEKNAIAAAQQDPQLTEKIQQDMNKIFSKTI
jgi:hypothetical protein